MDTGLTSFPEMRRDELACINQRRKEAFERSTRDQGDGETNRREPQHEKHPHSGPSPEPTFPEDQVETTLVGMACSGGGARSASFSLGVLQAFYRRGILRYVDYLSGVSGGGYATAFFSQTVCSTPGPVSWEAQPAGDTVLNRRKSPDLKQVGGDPEPQRLDIERTASGVQPRRIEEIGRRLASLNRPFQYLSRHLSGLVLINLFVLGGIVAVAALAAYLMRLPSDPVYRIYFAELGFRDDVSREFVPAAIAFLFWGIASAVTGLVSLFSTRSSRWRRTWELSQRVVTITYVCAIVAVVLGIANILGSGDVNILPTTRTFDFNPRVAEWIQSARNWITGGLAALFATALLPYLKLSRLLQSGTSQTSKPYERWIFSIASNAVVFGIPLIIYYLLAAENVSGYQKDRANQVLTSSSVENWSTFYAQVILHSDILPPDVLPPDVLPAEEIPSPEEHQIGFISKSLSTSAGPKTGLQGKPKRDDTKFTVADRAKIGDTIWRACDPKAQLLSKTLDLELRFKHPLTDIAALDQEILRDDSQYWIWQRWLWAADSLLTRQGDYQTFVARRVRRELLAASIADTLNRYIVTNPTFYNTIEGLDRPTRTWAENLEKKAEKLKDRITRNGTWKSTIDDKISPDWNKPGWWLTDTLAAMNRYLETADSTYALLSNTGSSTEKDQLRELRAIQSELLFVVREIRKVNFEILQKTLVKSVPVSPNGSKDVAVLSAPPFVRLETVFGKAVYRADQNWRLRVASGSAILFVLVGLGISLNWTSMHGYYRERLGRIWCGDDPEIPLSSLVTWTTGGPIPLWTGTLNRFCRGEDPQGHRNSLFLFSPLRCGTRQTEYVRTKKYRDGRLTLSETIAISGAALTPALEMSLLLRAFLFLTNSRLGQWLPTPSASRPAPRWPAPLRLLLSWFLYDPADRDFCFISDGGHSENLGIAPLLQRRCRTIIAIDGGYDPDSKFLDFAKMLQSAESRYGIRFESIGAPDEPLNLDPIRFADRKWLEHWIVAKILYPPRRRCPVRPD